tara:strand:+ start:59 stop:247 length:189 start_codon:yes stop_codon:yes gene_type:complete
VILRVFSSPTVGQVKESKRILCASWLIVGISVALLDLRDFVAVVFVATNRSLGRVHVECKRM